MSDFIKNAIIIVTIISVLLLVIPNIMSRFISQRLATYLYYKHFDEFDKLANSLVAKISIPGFNLSFMKLNAAFAKGGKAEILSTFAEFDNVYMNGQQKAKFLPTAFYYFVQQEDKTRSKKYLELIFEEPSIADKESYQDAYDIYIAKKADKLDDYLKTLDEAEDEEKLNLALLISKMYENKGEHAKSKNILKQYLG